MDRALSNRWVVRGGIGGGFDWVHVLPSEVAAGSGKVDRLETTNFVPMLRALALARYAFAPKSEFFFGLAADVDLSGTHYVTETIYPDKPRQTTPVFSPWLVRPVALIGITADVLAY